MSAAQNSSSTEEPCSQVRPEQPQCPLQVVTRRRRKVEQEKLRASEQNNTHSLSSKPTASQLSSPASTSPTLSSVGGVDTQLPTSLQILTSTSMQTSAPASELSAMSTPTLHTNAVPTLVSESSVVLSPSQFELRTSVAPVSSPEVPNGSSQQKPLSSSQMLAQMPPNVSHAPAIADSLQPVAPEPENLALKVPLSARQNLLSSGTAPANLPLLDPSTAPASLGSSLSKSLVVPPSLLISTSAFSNPSTNLSSLLPALPNPSPTLLNPALQVYSHRSTMSNLPQASCPSDPVPRQPDSSAEQPNLGLGPPVPLVSHVVHTTSHADGTSLSAVRPLSADPLQSSRSMSSVTETVTPSAGFALPASLQTQTLSVACLPITSAKLQTTSAGNSSKALCVSFQRELLGQCWQRIEMLKRTVTQQHDFLCVQKDEPEVESNCGGSNLLVSVPLSKVSVPLAVTSEAQTSPLISLSTGASHDVDISDAQPVARSQGLVTPHLPTSDDSVVRSVLPVVSHLSSLVSTLGETQHSIPNAQLKPDSLSGQQQPGVGGSTLNQSVSNEVNPSETASVNKHSPIAHSQKLSQGDCFVPETDGVVNEHEAKRQELTVCTATTASQPTQKEGNAVAATTVSVSASSSSSLAGKPTAMTDSNLESNEVLDSSGDISSDRTPEKNRATELACPPKNEGARPSREVAMQKRYEKAFLYDESIIDLIFEDEGDKPKGKHPNAKHTVQLSSQDKDKDKAKQKKVVKPKAETVEPPPPAAAANKGCDSPRTLRQRKGSVLPLALRTKPPAQKNKGHSEEPLEDKDDEFVPKKPRIDNSKLPDPLKLTFRKLPKNDKSGGRYVLKETEEPTKAAKASAGGGGGKSKGNKRVVLAPPPPREKNYWKQAQAWLPRNVPTSRTSTYTMRKTAHLLKPWKVDKKWLDENNRWKWLGDAISEEKYKEKGKSVTRQYFIGMRRGMKYAESVYVRDCVLVFSGDSEQFPYIGRILSFWQDSNSDEMMFTCTWYHRPQDVLSASLSPLYGEKELFASSHRDDNPVASILNKCYVMAYNEYCRFQATLALHQARATPTPHLSSRIVPAPGMPDVPRFHIPDVKVLEDATHVYYCKTSLLSARYNSNRLKVLTQALGGVKTSDGKRMSLLKGYSPKAAPPSP